jgi:D-sedoheptulose 7-phosphate isomerase
VRVPEETDFLYPFIERDERDAGALLLDLARSAAGKRDVGLALREATLSASAATLAATADAMATAFDAGGRLFSFGNGGSATDAASLAALFAHPPSGRALPARCLADDPAVLTALANDVGFDLAFSRQLIAHASAGDIAVGLSTSGSSRNVLTAFGEARRRGLITIGLAGYGGGEMVTSADVQHCLVVASDSVHRIQEVQASLAFALWAAAQERLGHDHG